MNPKIRVNRPIKLQALKIKDQIEQSDQIFANQTNQQPKFNQFLNQLSGMFNQLFKSLQKQPRQQISDIYLEPRDRTIVVDLPNSIDEQTLQKSQLEQWISQVSKKTFSTAFNNYFKDQMTFQQTKIYCSENILRNIALLAQKFSITTEHMNVINYHLKNRVLPYMNSKYPMTAATDINKAFEKTVKEIDNFNSITYDFILDTKVNFQYRQSGNYNDLIMRFLNQIMLKIDHKSKFNPEFSNFKDFQNLMTQIFLKTEDQDWANSKQGEENLIFDSKKVITEVITQINENNKKNQTNLRQYQSKISELKQKERLKQIQKEKYRTKVREYTHFLIGRKISQNTDIFSQEQIKGSNFKIKSPAILRILTKWCQQLQQKFTNQNYFTQIEQGVKIQKTGKIIAFYDWMKVQIKENIIKQKQQVDKLLKQIKENNYYFQSVLFTKQVREKNLSNQVEHIQKACAKASIHIVDSLHSYIIQYLNLLIHSLLKVAKQFYDKKVSKSWIDWKQSPVSLISFRIGDLMRCKCSSKEKQILKVFKQIEKLSEKDQNKIKIIRIKNRLKLGTNDILINVRYNNEINCQIQLAIHSSKSKFINCSSIFNHYLYELQRSMMDPITEMCCVWTNLDSRFRIYNKMVKSQKKKNLVEKCEEHEKHDLRPSVKPFICSVCQIAFTHNNFIKNNLKCSNCKFWTCARCLIEQEQPQKLAQMFFKNQKLRNASKRIRIKDQIPQFGACIKIQTKRTKVQNFKRMQLKGRTKLFGIQNKKLYEIQQITTTKQKQQFFNNYLVYKIEAQEINKEIKSIEYFTVNSQIILPRYVKQCSKNHIQTLKFLGQVQLTLQQWENLFKPNQKNSFYQIKNIILSSNDLSQINFIKENQFPSLEELSLEFNNLNNQQLISLMRFKNLKRLNISNNKLNKLTKETQQFACLEQLDVTQNRIEQISEDFCKLKNLSILKISQNSLRVLPSEFGQLQNLKTLIFEKNRIADINCIKNLKKIQILNANSNQVIQLPEQVQWRKLKFLNLSMNKIQKIPEHFLNLPCLQSFIIDSNQIQIIPASIKMLKSLVQFSIFNNQITQIPQQITQLKQLKIFKFEQNKISALSKSLEKLKKLENLQANNNQLSYLSLSQQIQKINLKLISVLKLQLSSNNLVKIPIFIQNLQNLIELKIDHNAIQALDETIISKLTKLKSLEIHHNQLKQIPNELCNLQQLYILKIHCNRIWIIPNSLSRLTNLKYFSFNANLIQSKKSIECYDFAIRIADPLSLLLMKNLPNLDDYQFQDDDKNQKEELSQPQQ